MNNSKRTYFKRKIYQKMLDWKRDKDGSTALLIKGGTSRWKVNGSGRICKE